MEVDAHIPLSNPYSYEGASVSWREEDLHRAFAQTDVLDGKTWENRRMSTLPFFSLNVAGSPGPMSLGSYAGDLTDFLPTDPMEDASLMLRVAKLGQLERKGS